METKQKLNLNAILKNKNIINSNKDEQELSKNKLDIHNSKDNNINKNIVKSETNDLKPPIIKVEENKNIIKSETNNLKPPIVKVEENKKEKIIKKDTQKTFISLNNIKAKNPEEIDTKEKAGNKEKVIETISKEKDKKIEENKQKLSKNTGSNNKTIIDNNKVSKSTNQDSNKKEKTDSGGEIFANYKTNYKTEKGFITQQIKRLKNIPKTNYKFLIGIIFSTIILIGFLFYINPADHSIKNYKASIFNILNRDKIEKKRDEITKEYNKLQEELKWKIEHTKYLGFNFIIEYRSIDGIKSYKYKNIEYSNKKELDKVLSIEVKNIKTGIIKNFIINSFK